MNGPGDPFGDLVLHREDVGELQREALALVRPAYQIRASCIP
jgi:hypothetical protein